MSSVLGGGSNATQSTAIGSLQFSTSQQGGVIPLVYGTTRVACNLLDYQDFTATPASASGAKGKGGAAGKSNGQFAYTASIVMGICQGPAVAFGLVWYNKSISPLPDMPGLSFMALGADGQDADPFWIANHAPDAIGYSGTCWFSADNYMLGMSPTLPNFSVEVLGAEVGSAANQADANPAAITIDFLTNPRYGAGFPAAHLDSLDDFRAYCDAAGIFLAPMIDQQSEAQQFLADLVKLTNSAIVWTGSTLKIVPYGDQPLATSYVLVRVSGDTVELDTLTLSFAAAGLPGSPVTVSYQAQPADVNTDAERGRYRQARSEPVSGRPRRRVGHPTPKPVSGRSFGGWNASTMSSAGTPAASSSSATGRFVPSYWSQTLPPRMSRWMTEPWTRCLPSQPLCITSSGPPSPADPAPRRGSESWRPQRQSAGRLFLRQRSRAWRRY